MIWKVIWESQALITPSLLLAPPGVTSDMDEGSLPLRPLFSSLLWWMGLSLVPSLRISVIHEWPWLESRHYFLMLGTVATTPYFPFFSQELSWSSSVQKSRLGLSEYCRSQFQVATMHPHWGGTLTANTLQSDSWHSMSTHQNMWEPSLSHPPSLNWLVWYHTYSMRFTCRLCAFQHFPGSLSTGPRLEVLTCCIELWMWA